MLARAVSITPAALALMLATVGLYGVIAHTVGQRRREFGIRFSLGARRADVLRLVVRRAGWTVAAGLVLGFAGAIAGSRFIASLLYGVEPVDLTTYGLVAATMAGVVLVASVVPARRAAAVDPVEVLRQE